MLTNSLSTDVASRFDRTVPQRPQRWEPLLLDAGSRFDARQDKRVDQVLSQADLSATDAIDAAIEICPSDGVKRRAVAWRGMAAEIVQATRRERIECRFRSRCHLLVLHEQGVRSEGESFVEGLPRSRLRDFKGKLTFLPAGHDYHEWQEPRVLGRTLYFYFDPACMPVPSDASPTHTLFAPRLFFEDATVRATALKLATSIEMAGHDNLYLEALGAVLAHELVRLNQGVARKEAPVRGGLATWRQRRVTAYIEEHLAEQVPLAKLAALVRLSPYHFCRAFKQSLGLPPRRYHTSRRIERAKTLLARSYPSVTEIGLTVGFNETSSFTAAFRRATGVTPTAYRRRLA